MSRKANPAMIGAFVVGAVVLAVAGTLVFGSGQLFKRTTKAVCFFSGDVSGLSVGAPVAFKGVQIGSVASIQLRLGEEGRRLSAEGISRGIRIPVIVEIDNDKLAAEGAESQLDRAKLKELVELGLRAQLTSQSLVTGLLFVSLDFYPDTPPVLVLPPDASLPEIPTIPTSLQLVRTAAQDLIRKLEDIDFQGLVASTTAAVDSVRHLVQSPALQNAVDALPETVANLNQTMTSVRTLATRVDREQEPLLQSLRKTSEKTAATVEEAKAAFKTVQALIAPNAPLAVDLATALREVAGAARALRLLADLLEREPSAIVRGRAGEGK